MKLSVVRSAVTVLACALFPGACGDPSGARRAGPPARVEAASGNEQSAPAGSELPQALVARVTDAKGRPVEDQVVNFVVVSGGGSVFAGTAQTNAAGEARERWTLGPSAADSQRVEARAVDATTGQPLVFAVFRATALSGSAANVVALDTTRRIAPAGSVLPDSFGVRVTDRFGNPVSGVQVSWAATVGGGSASPATSVTGAQGVAKTQWALGAFVDSAQTLEARPAGLPVVRFRSYGLLPAGSRLTVEGVPATAPVGRPLTVSATVRLADGRPVANAQVRWMLYQPDTRSSVSADTSRTGADGRATVAWTPQNVGENALLVRVTGGDVQVIVTGFVAPGPFVQLHAGLYHGCGLDAGGVAYCWGEPGNQFGQLGRGSDPAPTWRTRPVAGGTAFRQLAVGDQHTCGLTTAGRILCWGGGSLGALGNGSRENAFSPVPIASTLTFTSVAAGGGSTCAIAQGGAAYCWGSNANGQLGDGSSAEELGRPAENCSRSAIHPCRAHPVPVAGGHSFVSLSVGTQHVCALTAAGETFCWGVNRGGQLGDPAVQGLSTTPVRAAAGHSFRSVSAFRGSSCGLTAAGQVLCWGNNDTGDLGDGTGTSRTSPAPVAGGRSFSEQSGGCAITTGGEALCWGDNAFGRVGDGTTTPRSAPVAVAGGRRWAMISSGQFSSCGSTTNGEAFCWGLNNRSQLGDGTITNRWVPSAVRGPD